MIILALPRRIQRPCHYVRTVRASRDTAIIGMNSLELVPCQKSALPTRWGVAGTLRRASCDRPDFPAIACMSS